MRVIVILCLIVMLVAIPASISQGVYPPCWESELSLIFVAVSFHEIYFSLLDKVETATDLVNFAEGYLPYRERNWASNDRCAESIEMSWLTQQELSLRATYKAVDYGLRAKTDADPAVLAQYNPLSGALTDSFYPARFNQYVDHIQDLIDGGERRYTLSPEDGALPACNSAELASMAPILPDYRNILDAAQAVSSVDDLLALAEMQLRWRERWAQNDVSRSASGKISSTPRDGLEGLPACQEAAELLWLMHLTVSDASSSTALAYAGLYDYNNPYLQAFNQNADKADEMIARIESSAAEPGAELRNWTTCTDAQRARAQRTGCRQLNANLLLQEPSLRNARRNSSPTSKSHISWRDELWSSLPDCADALELALGVQSQFCG